MHSSIDSAGWIRCFVRIIPGDPPMTIARAHLVNPSVTRWYHCDALRATGLPARGRDARPQKLDRTSARGGCWAVSSPPAEPGCGKSPSVWACTTWRTWAAARRDDAVPKAGFQARLHFTWVSRPHQFNRRHASSTCRGVVRVFRRPPPWRVPNRGSGHGLEERLRESLLVRLPPGGVREWPRKTLGRTRSR